MANSASTPLAVAKDSAFITLSANQTSNLAQNNHVEFNTIVGNLNLSSGGGQNDGKITLQSGRKYTLMANVAGHLSGSNERCQWYDITNSTWLGSAAFINPINAGSADSSSSMAFATITPATSVQVELRFRSGSGFDTIYSDNSTNHFTSAWIESVEAYTPLVSTQSYIRRTNGLTRGSTNTNVVIFGTADVSVGTDITYQSSATNGDSFLINTSGIYSLSFTAGLGTVNTTIDLQVGSAIDNASLNSNSRASVRSSFNGGDPVSVAWTGYIAAGQVVWVYAANDLAGAAYTAITVARVR